MELQPAPIRLAQESTADVQLYCKAFAPAKFKVFVFHKKCQHSFRLFCEKATEQGLRESSLINFYNSVYGDLLRLVLSISRNAFPSSLPLLDYPSRVVHVEVQDIRFVCHPDIVPLVFQQRESLDPVFALLPAAQSGLPDTNAVY